VRVASGPDKAGTGQYCQMAWAWRAGWKGVRKEPAFTSLKLGPAQIWWIGAGSGAHPPAGRGTLWLAFGGWPGGHGEVLRGSRGDAAGTEPGSSFVKRITVNTGTVPVLPAAAHPARWCGLSAPTADRSGMGRSRRSTPGRGKPGTWGRAAAVSGREGGCNAARRAAERQRTGLWRIIRVAGSGDAGQASPLGGGRSWPQVR